MHSLQSNWNLDQFGGFNPSEKYESVGIIVPNTWKNKSHVPNHQPGICDPNGIQWVYDVSRIPLNRDARGSRRCTSDFKR